MTAADLDDVLALNEHWVPHVGALDRGRLEGIMAQAELALAARASDGSLVGFVIGLGAGADYDSPNYEWFCARHVAFTYVDRIAISPGAQGRGVGRHLYGSVLDHAAAVESPTVCAEVNLDPPNVASQRFHGAMGFVEVGRQWTYRDTVQVQMLELDL